MLEWKEMEQPEIIKSPILLASVELRRDSVNDPFELWPGDEEIVINAALAVKLGDDFGIGVSAASTGDFRHKHCASYRLSKVVLE
jgi:hypothetical protein